MRKAIETKLNKTENTFFIVGAQDENAENSNEADLEGTTH